MWIWDHGFKPAHPSTGGLSLSFSPGEASGLEGRTDIPDWKPLSATDQLWEFKHLLHLPSLPRLENGASLKI